MKLTKRQYYDKLLVAACDGTFPSGHNGVCYYRRDAKADCKQRCAVGLLIPDEFYQSSFEGSYVWCLPKDLREEILPEGMTEYQLSLIQKLHDDYSSNWDGKLFVERLKDMGCFKEFQRES